MNNMAISTYLSVFAFSVKELSAPIIRYWVAEWIQKQDMYIYCLKETHFRFKDKHVL